MYKDELIPEEGLCFKDVVDAHTTINSWIESLYRTDKVRLGELLDEATVREIKNEGEFREDVLRIIEAAAIQCGTDNIEARNEGEERIVKIPDDVHGTFRVKSSSDAQTSSKNIIYLPRG